MHNYEIGQAASAHMDGGQTEGTFYLRGFEAHQVPKKQRTQALADAAFEGRDVEGVAEVDHLLALADEPGAPAQWLEVALPGPEADRSDQRIRGYYQGQREGVSTVTVLLRRSDVRQFAAEIYRRRLTDVLEALEDTEFTAERLDALKQAWLALAPKKRVRR